MIVTATTSATAALLTAGVILNNWAAGNIGWQCVTAVEHQELVAEACKKRGQVVEVAPVVIPLVKDFDWAIDWPIA